MTSEQASEPWRPYYDEFRKVAGRVPPDAFDRASLLYEAAHDVYQNTTDRLTASGMDEEHALVIGRMFGAVVKEWLDNGDADVERLEQDLQTTYAKLLSMH
jgi:hypothetical protein